MVYYLKVSGCIIPDSAVLTLREEKPSADSCGDPFLEKLTEGFLPVGCGTAAVFNFSWEKEIIPYGSGDDEDDGDDDIYFISPVTTVIPTRTLLSTTTIRRTPQSTIRVGSVSVTSRISTSRLPPRFTPSPESRYSSFQRLLRIHLNTFNQRLSMLESNTLDMKESIHSMHDQQSHLSSQLKELIAIQSAGEKNKKVGELEKGYTDMDTRLSRLEGRLEILIDGFTALAQEMNKMKRVRHVARSPQENRALPSLSLAIPLYSTSPRPVRSTPTETPLTSRATVSKSIPTPGLPVNSAPQRGRKLRPAATKKSDTQTTKLRSVTRSPRSQVSTSSAKKSKTTSSKPRTSSKIKPKAALKPETKRPEGRRIAVTAKHVSKPNQTRSKKVKPEATITKFQLEPPPHKSKSAGVPQLRKQSDQANKKDSAPSNKNNRRNKVFRSDAPVPKTVPESGESSKGDSKTSSKSQRSNVKQNEKKLRNSHNLPARKSKNSIKDTTTTTKPTVSTTAKKSRTKVKTTTTAQTKVTTGKKKITTTAKRKSTPSKTKSATTAKKVAKKPQQKKTENPRSGVLDLLRLLKGDKNSAKHKTNQDGSLHVVLGRLAIPIKIIPDD